MLPLTFVDATSYDDVGEGDRISVLGLSSLTPGEDVHCVITKTEGIEVEFSCRHTFSHEQLAWFRAGSALNVIRNERIRHQHDVMTRS
jgi:aconitate hydratase